MCQPHKVGMNALERLLRIHTHDIISSSPPSMTREALWPLWSHIFTQMVDVTMYYHPKICLFDSINQENTKKKLNTSKNFKKKCEGRDSLPMSPYADPGGNGMSGSPWKYILA